jgi:hypothetical protein
VQRLQEPELHDGKEQKEACRPNGDQEVLQYVQKTHRSPRSEVTEFIAEQLSESTLCIRARLLRVKGE